MGMHFANVFEAVTDAVPDAIAVVDATNRRTWAEYDDRAARVAGGLRAAGLGRTSKVGLYLYNGNEYLEAQYGTFKLGGTPVNVNYRYLDDELAYLLDNADAEALVYHSSLADRVERVRARLPRLKLLVEVDDGGDHLDGAVPFEQLMAASAPLPRTDHPDDDVYMLYTGGTTGMPKGVMYPNGDFSAALAGMAHTAVGRAVPTTPAEVAAAAAELRAAGAAPVSIPACPLMHGTGMWIGCFFPHSLGGTVVTLPNRTFDADDLFRTVEAEGVSWVVIVGDAFAKPMVKALRAATERGAPYDTSSLQMVLSSGVMWTAEVKQELLDLVPQAVLFDIIGSTEGGMGSTVAAKGLPPTTAKFALNPTTKVFTEDGREVVPGSGEMGMVATSGLVPLGYYKDPEKSARTFREIDGVRWSFPGDWAVVEADGTITLLGRGSQCINTGGEKVFPEEVEEAVKRVPGVEDCLVVGVPDDRFGEAVTAVVGAGEGELDEAGIIAAVKRDLAHYKAPKRIVFVDRVPRAPNGKADYKTAKELARAATAT